MSLGSHHHGAHGHGQMALIDALTGEHASMAANRLVRRSVNVSMGVTEAACTWPIAWQAFSEDRPDLAARLRVTAFPTVIAFRGGVERARRVGLTTLPRLMELCEAAS